MKTMSRTVATVLTGILSLGAANVVAQGYPAKPVRLVVPFAPGGAVDTIARLFGQKFTEAWKQSVVVENRPGAGGTIAADVVAKAAPDGYTLLINTHGQAISPSIYRKLPFDAVKDFAPVSQLTSSFLILAVNPSVPANSVGELIALAKAQPGRLNYASTGSGAPPHLVSELFKIVTGTQILHIPYKGDAPAYAALIAGEVQMSFGPLSGVLPQIKAGKLRALAITNPTRSPAMPEVPTMVEAGVRELELTGWLGLFAPAGPPADILRSVQAEVVKALPTPEVRDRLPTMGYEPVGSTPEQFGAKYRSDIAIYARIVKEAGVPPAD